MSSAERPASTREDPPIRPLDPTSAAEVELVATRMRLTLMEVLGEEAGAAMYTMDWLRQRVRWHLDPAQTTARIFLAEDPDGHITGHTIVRLEKDEAGQAFGLFSTTYVEPESRRHAIARHLIQRGEAWMIGHGMPRAVTDTSETNTKLIGLFESVGYAIVERHPVPGHAPMVRLAKVLVT